MERHFIGFQYVINALVTKLNMNALKDIFINTQLEDQLFEYQFNKKWKIDFKNKILLLV